MITILIYTNLSLLNKINETEGHIMTPEAWIALAALAVGFISGLIGIWVKTKSEIEVMKSEVATLREMVAKQISIDEEIKNTLTDLKIGQARLEEKISKG